VALISTPKMRIIEIQGPPFNEAGEGIHFKVRDDKPTGDYIGYNAKLIEARKGSAFGPGSKVYHVWTWDDRYIEINGAMLESVEWAEVPE